MTDRQRIPSLTALLQLTSPALPIGAYAYSNGLEYAVSAGWLKDEDDTRNWIMNLAQHGICRLDVPIVQRLFDSWQANELEQVRYWGRYLNASRGASELLAEDRHLGTALARLLSDLGIREARKWMDSSITNWALMFSLAATRWNISVDDTLCGYMWSWCENQVTAAVRLVPLGQTAGQRILLEIGRQMPAMIETGQTLTDDEIGQSAPGLMIASALHENQYSRLFRS